MRWEMKWENGRWWDDKMVNRYHFISCSHLMSLFYNDHLPPIHHYWKYHKWRWKIFICLTIYHLILISSHFMIPPHLGWSSHFSSTISSHDLTPSGLMIGIILNTNLDKRKEERERRSWDGRLWDRWDGKLDEMVNNFIIPSNTWEPFLNVIKRENMMMNDDEWFHLII